MMHGTIISSEIYTDCLLHLNEVADHEFVLRKSIPIPYFGDLEEYRNSRIRVLTAALNPSDREFPEAQPRFNVAKGRRGPADLEAELSRYFHVNPYRAWFSSFEPVLNGLGASYGGRMATKKYNSTALHVDMCSPIATAPTWSQLTPTQRQALKPKGREIFEKLVDALEPHIIVASIGWGHLQDWKDDFREGRSWKSIVEHRTSASGERLRAPLRVQVGRISHEKGKLPFANASAADRPFGRFTTERKIVAGETLLDWLEAAQ